PKGKNDPEGGLQTGVSGPSFTSVAITVKLTGLGSLLLASMIRSPLASPGGVIAMVPVTIVRDRSGLIFTSRPMPVPGLAAAPRHEQVAIAVERQHATAACGHVGRRLQRRQIAGQARDEATAGCSVSVRRHGEVARVSPTSDDDVPIAIEDQCGILVAEPLNP